MSDPTRSCITCTSFVPSTDVRTAISTSYGPMVDYCSTRGIPLSRGVHQHATERSETMVAIGNACPSHTTTPSPMETPPVQKSGQVGGPTKPPPLRHSSETCPSNCRDCTYFVSPSEMNTRVGWTQGLCTARGILLPGRRTSQECKGCVFGVTEGSMFRELDRPGLDDFELNGVYGYEIPAHVDPLLAVATTTALPDPRLHATDLEVSESDQADGIRAWRRITHPRNARKSELFLPIFDPDFFSAAERELIPQAGERTRPEMYVDYQDLVHSAAVSFVTGRTPALFGHAGVGKTDLFVHLAWLLQLPFSRVSVNQQSEVSDLVGKHLVEIDPGSGESITSWIDGRVPKRWKRPGVLLIDEPNAGPDEVWTVFRPLMDGAEELVLDQDRGQVLAKDPWCLMGMAMNPVWDVRYTGLAPLGEADGNRLDSVWVDYPPRDVERNVIVMKCNAEGYGISNADVETVLRVGSEIRDMANMGGELTVSWGLRLSIEVARKLQYLEMEEAFARVIGDRLEPDQREIVLRVIKSHESSAF